MLPIIKQLLAGRTTKMLSLHLLLLLHAFPKSSALSPCKTTSNSIQSKQQAKAILSTTGTALPAKLLILLHKLQ